MSLVTALLQANGIVPRVPQPANEGVEIIEIPASPPPAGSPPQSPKAKVDVCEEEDANTAAILARERELLVSDVYIKLVVTIYNYYRLNWSKFVWRSAPLVYRRIDA